MDYLLRRLKEERLALSKSKSTERMPKLNLIPRWEPNGTT
jgi:hypothetical protein